MEQRTRNRRSDVANGSLDQIFTSSAFQEECCDIVMKLCGSDFDAFVDSSCGDGYMGFLMLANDKKVQLVDIDDTNLGFEASVTCAFDKDDWMTTDLRVSERACVGFNPPFGHKGKVAREFILRSLDVAPNVNVLAWIVPNLSTQSTAWRPRGFAEVHTAPVPPGVFTRSDGTVARGVRAGFVVWKRDHAAWQDREAEDLALREAPFPNGFYYTRWSSRFESRYAGRAELDDVPKVTTEFLLRTSGDPSGNMIYWNPDTHRVEVANKNKAGRPYVNAEGISKPQYAVIGVPTEWEGPKRILVMCMISDVLASRRRIMFKAGISALDVKMALIDAMADSE